MRYELDGLSLRMCDEHRKVHGAALRLAGWFAFRLVEMART